MNPLRAIRKSEILDMALVLLSGVAFFIWAPWNGARSVAEAEILYERQFPSEWSAVVSNHGTFRNHPWGVPDSRPVAYAALTGLVFGPVAVVFLSGFFSGYRRAGRDARGSQMPNTSLERTREE
jgi:hypothetical protein